LSVAIRADELAARYIRAGCANATGAAGWGGTWLELAAVIATLAGLECAASTVVTTIARRWVVTTAGVHAEDTRGALDGDVKLPGVRLASETMGPQEYRLGA